MIIINEYENIIETQRGFRHITYSGIQSITGRPVMIKYFSFENLTSSQVIHLTHEYEQARHIDSKYIARVFNYEKIRDQNWNGLLFFIENPAGILLSDYLLRKKIIIRELLDTAVQVALGLKELHRNDIVHSDINPASIVLNPETRSVWLRDFGFNSINAYKTDEIRSREIIKNVLPYISPEQTGRTSRRVDHRSDFYSLGMVMYEVLTGTPPFFSPDPIEIMHSHIARQPQPPAAVRETIPPAISDIVMKMISKDPESRYQSAQGLISDLEECMKQLQQKGKIESFATGRNDLHDRFIIPQKMYGRKKEIAALASLLEETRQGRSRFLLISGSGGIGKSTLIQDVQRSVIRHNGYYAYGKYNTIDSDIPYSGLIQALQGLVNQILSENDEQLQSWKTGIQAALGPNGKIILDMIPDSKLLIGVQPELPETGPAETRNRFTTALGTFIRLFAAENHPLTLILEDLQWADPASFNLLASLAEDPVLSHALIIGSYRDDAISDAHPLAAMIAQFSRRNVPAISIELQPLALTEVARIISDTLMCGESASRELAELIHQKTGGNPFFIKQFLKRLHEEDVLVYAAPSGWIWDMERIGKVQATENVIDLMIKRINRLQAPAREVLKAAAVAGTWFTAEMLSEVCGKPLDGILRDLDEPLQNELIIASPAGYTFSHDRFHESLFSMIPPEEMQGLHYRIGHLLLKQTPGEQIPEKLFSILDHVNHSLVCFTDPAEQWSIVRMNLAAARKARLTTAYGSALKYIEYAMSLLPPDAWERDYETTFSIFLEKAQAQQMAGSFQDSESVIDTLLARARSDIDRAKIYSFLIVLRSYQNRNDEAIALGLTALGLFNLKMPRAPNRARLAKDLLTVRAGLRNTSIDRLFNLPELDDENILTIMDIMSKITVPAYFSNTITDMNLILSLSLAILKMTLKHGNSRYSSYAYVIYGAALGVRLKDYAHGYEYGKLGVALNEKFHDAEMKARVCHLFAALVCCWKRPFAEYIDYFTTALQAGITSGDFLFTSYAIMNLFSHSIRKGVDISSLILIYETHMSFINLSHFTMARDIINIFYALVLRLKGPSDESGRNQIPGYDEEDVIRRAQRNKIVLYQLYLTKMISSCLFGEYKPALQYASLIARDVDVFFSTTIHLSEYYFYYSLSIAGCYEQLTDRERKQYRPVIQKSIRLFKNWSENCPENFLHLYHMLVAEMQKIDNGAEALEYYGKAIHFSQQNGYINHETIICERTAEFHIRHGDITAAKAHIQQAHACCAEWGATAKLRDIELKYPSYVLQTQQAEAPSARHANYASIVNSLQAISSEIIIEELLKKLMKMAVENAGADRGYFINVTGEPATARIIAETTMADEVMTVITSAPLSESRDILVPVVNYVMRLKKHVVIDDARTEESLPLGPYLTDDMPRSVLCLPVVRHARLSGVLYLENRIATGAFTADHIEILELLSSQAAISLEIAQLYDKLTQEITQHWKAEAALRESEDRYRMVVESMNEGICVLNENGILKFVNTRFCEMIDYDREMIVNQPLERFLNDAGKATLRHQLMRRRRGENEPYELDLIKRDGRGISTIVSPRPVYDGDGNFAGSFGLFTDITEKKKMEEDLLKASKIESLGVFAGGIAHDFNNLLTAIIGNISLARLNMQQQDKNYTILIEAENASMRAKDLTHQLLTFSKGGAPIKKTVSVKKLVRQTIDFALSGSKIVCIYTIQNDLWNAEIDEGQISQVIHNLVINAMQAMQEGGALEVMVRNEILDARSRLPLTSGNYIRISITDHGAGIPPENHKYIFDPYFTTKENGSGLGLTVSYSIIRRHEGHISFESEVGRGTTFTIYLPASREQVADTDTEEQKNVSAMGRVLVMDDDQVVLRVAGNMLQHLGLSADFAAHGEEAITKYRESLDSGAPYDLIIMDLTVPGHMGGKDAIIQLKKIDPDVRAIVSSGYSNDPVMANFADYGFIDMVAKPYRIEDLKAVINRVLSSGRAG